MPSFCRRGLIAGSGGARPHRSRAVGRQRDRSVRTSATLPNREFVSLGVEVSSTPIPAAARYAGSPGAVPVDVVRGALKARRDAALTDFLAQGLDQPGLPDPRLARQEDDLPATARRRLPAPARARRLLLPADQGARSARVQPRNDWPRGAGGGPATAHGLREAIQPLGAEVLAVEAPAEQGARTAAITTESGDAGVWSRPTGSASHPGPLPPPRSPSR